MSCARVGGAIPELALAAAPAHRSALLLRILAPPTPIAHHHASSSTSSPSSEAKANGRVVTCRPQTSLPPSLKICLAQGHFVMSLLQWRALALLRLAGRCVTQPPKPFTQKYNDASDQPWCVIGDKCSHASDSGQMGTC